MVYTQKWSIVSFLEPVKEGTQFYWKDWPLHVTIASVFDVEWSKELHDELQKIAEDQRPISLRAVEVGYWGEVDRYHCAILEKTPDIMSLHNKVFQLLKKHSATFNEIQYHGEGFVPHSTYQKHAHVSTDDTVTIGSFSIVDMFPNGDHLERVVTKTLQLK